MSWTTQSGIYVFLEIRGNVFDGVVVRDVEGKVIRRRETYQYRRWPNGREDTSRGEIIAEFSDLPGDRTLAWITQTRKFSAGLVNQPRQNDALPGAAEILRP